MSPPPRSRTTRVVSLGRIGRRSPLALVLGEWTVCNVGHWAVMGTLTLYLVVALHLSTVVAGVLFTFASFSFRLTRFLTAGLVGRLSPRDAVVGSMIVGASAYAGIAATTSPFVIALLLPLVGAGYGSNELVVKSLAAEGDERSRIVRYAAISTGLNVAAAVGPVIGNTLFLHWSPRGVFLVSAAAFAVAAAVGLLLPSARPTALPELGTLQSMRALLRAPLVRHALLLVFLGFLLYSQLFATLPLVTHELLDAPEALSGYFALNAVLAGLGQVPAGRLAQAWRIPPDGLVRSSYLTFGIGFALLWLAPSAAVGYGAVAIWTLAEILLGPALDTVLAGAVRAQERVVVFTLSAGAMALGEGLGALASIPLAGHLADAGRLADLYLVFTTLALVSIGVASISGRVAASRLVRPAPTPSVAPTEEAR